MCIRRETEEPRVLYNEGMLCSHQPPLVTGSPEKAVAHYQQAITLSPSHHVAMGNLGRLYRSLGDNSVAEEWYKR